MDSATGQHRIRAPPEPAAYRFCGFALDPARGVLRRPDGAEVGLRPKSTEVLRHLAQHPTDVVSRDDLMEAVWPGVSVTDDSITQCVTEIRRALGDEGAQMLRTLPRRGYTLAAEVTSGDRPPPATGIVPIGPEEAAATAAPPAAPGPDLGPAGRRRRPLPLFVGGGLIAAMLAATVGWWGLPRSPLGPAPPATAILPAPPVVRAPDAAAPVRPLSLVVLPFANTGGDAGQDHVASGVTDDLTAALALVPGSFVVGRGTALLYKGRAADARQVGRELGVRYIVDGSARRLGDRLRVNAQLLDAETGAHLWVGAFDEPFAEVAEVSQMVATRIASALNQPLLFAEASRTGVARPHDPDAADLILRGRVFLAGTPGLERYHEAYRLFERAVALDGASASAHGYLAHALTALWNNGWPEDREGLLVRAEEHARRALALDPRLARGHYVLGIVNQSRQRFDLALARFDVALAHYPNFVAVHARRGWVMTLIDRPEEAMAAFREALWISPREPNRGISHKGMAHASLMLGRAEDAVAHSVRAVASNPDVAAAHFDLAAHLALAGRTDEARAALREALRLQPGATAAGLRRSFLEQSEYPLWVAAREREIEALRAIGMPEG